MHNIPVVNHVLIAPLSTNARIDTSLAVGSYETGEILLRIGVAGELFVRILKSVFWDFSNPLISPRYLK